MSTITITKKISGKRKRVELNRYAGKWVAFIDGRIVANADYLPLLEKEMKKKRLEKKAVYFLVPRKDEGPYVLFIPLEAKYPVACRGDECLVDCAVNTGFNTPHVSF